MQEKTRNRKYEEKRTLTVFVLSGVMMIAEIAIGFICNSMALIANGVHLASHVVIVGLSWSAYWFIRRLENQGNTIYDKDKILNLTAFTSGLTLLAAAFVVIVESAERFFGHKIVVATDSSVAIAVAGLVINVICALILHSKHNDVNIQAVFLHVISDVIVDLGVIASLLCARYLGIVWIDLIVALISSVIIIRWAVKLLRVTGKALVANQSFQSLS